MAQNPDRGIVLRGHPGQRDEIRRGLPQIERHPDHAHPRPRS
eukprot:CAMPEP_0195274122 /NCGR_PEP_ID=MMETSP0706-20130129/16953_1 /TAXON_ID=33640 /ORGANISM="Asterionellopsis glacialis, Strain CCMP134" /LENGTH=41 /DNA_ID= /DNA_START= /DNA_END= /DNA_ORIENTATION=